MPRDTYLVDAERLGVDVYGGMGSFDTGLVHLGQAPGGKSEFGFIRGVGRSFFKGGRFKCYFRK